MIDSSQVLFVGDIHLGRWPTHLPPNLADNGLSPGLLSPERAWLNVVEYAIEHRVSAVLLAGDVVESNNRFYEAYGPLQSGVSQLVEHGISVMAVAGNHDVDVLPKLADSITDFKLLGRNGQWEAVTLQSAGHDFLTILGWSFPQKQVRISPLSTLPLRENNDTPVVGLLHCDLDQNHSVYAPVKSAELQQSALDAWLLGHIHSPSALDHGKPMGYLGSLTGLDPTEIGCHGPWLMSVNGHDLTMTQVPLAPLRWERVEVSVDGLAHLDDFSGLVTRAIDSLHSRLQMLGQLTHVQAVGIRMRTTGRTQCHRQLSAHFESPDGPTRLKVMKDEVLYFVDKVTDESVPQRDLEAIARQTDPPGLLARKLLSLHRGTDTDLIVAARRQMATEANSPRWTAADAPEFTDSDVRDYLLRAGYFALEELLAQQAVRP